MEVVMEADNQVTGPQRDERGHHKEDEVSSGVTLEGTSSPYTSVNISAEGATSEDTGE